MPPPLDNGDKSGSRAFMSYLIFLGKNVLYQMISLYCKSKHCLLTLNASYIFKGLGYLSFDVLDKGFVDRDLTKFQDCVFLYTWCLLLGLYCAYEFIEK